jgi:hypothetical protein
VTVSAKIRAAALGPTPRHALRTVRSDWLDWHTFMQVGKALGKGWCINEFWESRSVIEKRMFLLFVADAIEESSESAPTGATE